MENLARAFQGLPPKSECAGRIWQCTQRYSKGTPGILGPGGCESWGHYFHCKTAPKTGDQTPSLKFRYSDDAGDTWTNWDGVSQESRDTINAMHGGPVQTKG